MADERPCGIFRPTVKPRWCKCGWAAVAHADDAFPKTPGIVWGWRGRTLAQPDESECE